MVTVSYLQDTDLGQHDPDELRHENIEDETWNHNHEDNVKLDAICRRQGLGSTRWIQKGNSDWEGERDCPMNESHQEDNEIFVSIQFPFIGSDYQPPYEAHQVYIHCSSYK